MSQREYFAIGPKCWGKGKDRAAATKAMRRNWPSMVQPNAEYVVYSCPPGTRVTEFGELAYPKDADKPPFEVSRGAANRGGLIPASA